ncbi:hypothetical protein DFS33DRAFT_1383718 [Desarmillaria ectypa]|nr:hypothetical protein DFS33DRAFT_1383718 [Desarmillaria ectypa]
MEAWNQFVMEGQQIESNLRDCENQLVGLFDYQSFHLTTGLLKDRDFVVWCTKFMRSDADERVNAEVAMHEKAGNRQTKAWPFTVPKTHRVQSKLYPIAFGTDEPIPILCVPTGTGKSNVAVLTILNELSKYRDGTTGTFDLDTFKTIYVASMKASVQRMVARLKLFGIKVGELTGDSNDEATDYRTSSYQEFPSFFSRPNLLYGPHRIRTRVKNKHQPLYSLETHFPEEGSQDARDFATFVNSYATLDATHELVGRDYTVGAPIILQVALAWDIDKGGEEGDQMFIAPFYPGKKRANLVVGEPSTRQLLVIKQDTAMRIYSNCIWT